MIVVSNTSPLTNLASIGQIDLLHKLYKEIHIPEGVWQELNAYGKRWPGSVEVEQAEWIQRHIVKDQNLVTALQKDIDRGEAESIVLALELQATLIILDEQKGRYIAERMGLEVTGVIGVLLSAKSQDLVESIRPYLDILKQEAGFYISDTVYDKALTLAGEPL